MECFEPGVVKPHNVFTGGYGLDMQRAKAGGKTVDPEGYHTFGVLWNEKGYTFYVDGVEDGHIDQFISKRPEFILITTEVKGYRYEDHRPVKEAKAAEGDTFVVDYVRVFDAI